MNHMYYLNRKLMFELKLMVQIKMKKLRFPLGMYTLLEKKRKFLNVAFLLKKIVCHCMFQYMSLRRNHETELL